MKIYELDRRELDTDYGNTTKNYLINGGFNTWQRGGNYSGVAASTVQGYKSADRWHITTSTFPATINNLGEQAGVLPPSGLSSRSALIGFTSGANPNLSLAFRQHVESREAIELSGKIVSLGLWVLTDEIQQVQLRIFNQTVTDSSSGWVTYYNQNRTVVANSTWQFVKFENILMPSDLKYGFAVILNFQNALAGSGNKVLRLGEVMLNRGPYCLPFVPFGGTVESDIQACYRYCEAINGVFVACRYGGGAGNSWYVFGQMQPKRVAATFQNITNCTVSSGAPSTNQIGFLGFNPAGYVTHSGAGAIYGGCDPSGSFTLSMELTSANIGAGVFSYCIANYSSKILVFDAEIS